MYQNKRLLSIGIPILFSMITLGCASPHVKVVEKEFVSTPVSSTDEASRRLALKTFQRLGELYQDYRVGPEDVLEITIFEWELREATKSVQIRVSETGILSLPVVGEINVKGLTVEGIKSWIEKRLREGQIIPNPRVSVVVQQFRSKRVAVVGAVKDPGTYTLRTNVATLLEMLSLAGGPDERAGQVAYVIRSVDLKAVTGGGKGALKDSQARGSDPAEGTGPEASYRFQAPGKEVISIDLCELLEQGDMSLNVLVGDGDVVNVPEARRFQVVGFVRDPGSFALKKPTTVLEGIAMARGLQEEEASKTKCALKRKNAQGEVIIPLNLTAIAKGKQPNIYLQPDDVIIVRQTALRRSLLYVYNFIRSVWTLGFTKSL